MSNIGKLPFEEALNRTGFGLYSIQLTVFTGVIVIAFVCVAYGSTIIIPASACELNTNVTQQGALAAAPIFGLIIGAIIWGLLADVYGRKRVLVPCIVLSTIFNVIASVSVNWLMLLAFQFLASTMAAGMSSVSFALLTECVPLDKRNILMLIVTSIFLMSQGVMALLAIPIIPLTFSYYISTLHIYWNSWRTLLLVYCLPNLFCLCWLLLIEESPKYFISRGKEKEALGVLQKIYSVNTFSKSEFHVKGLLSENNVEVKKKQIGPLFRLPLLKYTIITSGLFISVLMVGGFMIWLPTIANQYVKVIQTGEGMDSNICGVLGTALEGSNSTQSSDVAPCAINKSALLIVFGVGFSHSVVNLIICLIVDKLGRRNSAMSVSIICGVSGIIVNLVPNAIGSAVFFAVFVTGIINVGLFNMITLATFPTHVRATALALATTSGRIASFLTVQILNYFLVNHCQLGFYIIAGVFTASSLLAYSLPDDRKTEINNSLEDSENSANSL